MTEQEEKKSSRKRKVVSTEEVERKTTPKRAAKTKTEEAKAAATSTASTASTSSSKTKKKKTEKTEGEEISNLPKQKQFLANAKDLQVVISDAPLVPKEEGDNKTNEVKEETTDTKNGADQTNKSLFTFIAKPNKISNGYGWSATLVKAKIKIEIDGNQVELPATINLNITVGTGKKIIMRKSTLNCTLVRLY